MQSHMSFFTSTTRKRDEGSFGRKRPEDFVRLWGPSGLVHRPRRFR